MQCVCVCVVTEPGTDADAVLEQAGTMLKVKHSITQSTLQVEKYKLAMDDCGTCREPQRHSFLRSLIPACFCYTSKT